MKNIKKTLIAAAAVTGMGLAAPSFAYGVGDFFGPVPTPIQRAMSGLTFSVGQLHQNYADTLSREAALLIR